MKLLMNEYPDAWRFSESQPSPPPDYPLGNKVEAFIDTFLSDNYFQKIVIWKNQLLRNSHAYPIAPKGEHCIYIDSLQRAKSLKSEIMLSSDYKGELSVIFIAKNPTSFIKKGSHPK